MYAIIDDGGRQFRVQEGQEIDIDLRDVSQGDKLTFERVLAISSEDQVSIGKPDLTGANVTAEVLGVKMGPKLVVQKLRKRKNSRRKTGHRQMYTTIRVDKISE